MPAVLFDLDGVLLDTEGLYTAATSAVLGRFGKAFDWTLKRDTMGRDALVSARIVTERLGIPLSPEAFLAERQPILERLCEASPAFPEAEAFVRGLGGAGVPIAVATSSDRALYELKVRPHAWFGCFGAVVCGDDPRVRSKKPAPDIFLAAATSLGVSARDCVIFEDSAAGVEAALAAGARVIVLAHPPADADHEREFYAPMSARVKVVDGWKQVAPSLVRDW